MDRIRQAHGTGWNEEPKRIVRRLVTIVTLIRPRFGESPPFVFACIGAMNRGPSRVGRKAPINRTHSRRCARFGEARQSRSVWSACVFSAAFSRRCESMAVCSFFSAPERGRATGNSATPVCARRLGTLDRCRGWLLTALENRSGVTFASSVSGGIESGIHSRCFPAYHVSDYRSPQA